MTLRSSCWVPRRLALAAAMAASALAPVSAQAARGPCEKVAQSQYSACKEQSEADFDVAKAVCRNGRPARELQCIAGARDERSEARSLCREQRDAREELCDALGGGRFDPDFDPDHFDDDFSDLTNPNPYFPLSIGTEWRYEGAESITIEVREATKEIEGVTCIVVNDRVEEEGELVEDTDDWFAQREDGTVVYCGEEAKDFEIFDGDDPEHPELVSIDGSFKAGRDGALPGTQFLASPQVGVVYRQEWSPGNAEDAARVLSTTYRYGDDPALDAHVPEDLAELLCDGDCVVIEEFSPLEPDAVGRKYYARGIGLFLDVDTESGDVAQLVECSGALDPRCSALPSP